MALFNKLFPGLKTTPQNSHEDNVSQKVSPFNTEQVRIVLFRECDFRGRKLLFDSDATEKIPVEKAEQDKTFVEVSNGYGYLIISKQNSDYLQLSEMAFGSVAMSFRGTYFKIHSLGAPTRLMFTQVFPSPHGRRKNTSSTSSYQSHMSTQSFEHSIKLDDSGASSNFSTSDRLSDRSTASDTVLVCRRFKSSPLDVPGVESSFSKTSLVVDSGCTDQSFSSFSTGPLTFPTWESVFSHKGTSTTSLSSCGVFKRLLRSSTRSLQNSSISLPNSTEVLLKGHNRISKLGLTIIVEIPSDREQFFTQLFMEHIALLEALIWRTRLAIEIAYHRPSTFISQMMDIAQSTASWLVNLLNAPRIVTNLWLCLSGGCDNYTSINAFTSELDNKSLNLRRTSRTKSSCVLSSSDTSDRLSSSNSFSGLPFRNRTDIFNFNFSKFLKTDWDRSSKRSFNEGELVVDKFLREFCELLEEFDVKDTNFFMSTLLTAVLTHHLGWVTTVFPSSVIDEKTICNFKQPYNALWDQLTDLYGAVGHPVKTAQTVVIGSNRNNIISRILDSLTYFIRFGNLARKHVERSCVELENKSAEVICMKNNCIPNEYYKRYEDHLKEMLTAESPKPCCSEIINENYKKRFKFAEEVTQPNESVDMMEITKKEERKIQLMSSKGLLKMQSHDDLSKLVFKENCEQSPAPPKGSGLSRVPSSLQNVLKANFGKITSMNQISFVDGGSSSSMYKGCEENLNNFSQKVCNFNDQTLAKTCNFVDFAKLEKKTELKEQSGCDINENLMESSYEKSNVIFVLGDNEKLVGLKKEENCSLISPKETKDINVVSGAKRKISIAKRPCSLSLSKVNYEFSKSPNESKIPEPVKDYSSCNKCLMHSSSSYESLCLENKDLSRVIHSERECRLNTRAQSEPPELRKISPPKYQYSRVKFNLQQYPQVVRNYMKSKNIELEGLSLGEKAFDKFATVQHNIKLDFSGYESESEEVEALQTPSNASELEFRSDMCEETSREDSKEASTSKLETISKLMMLVNIPMPKTIISSNPEYSVSYTSTVMKGLVDSYIPDMVLQGTTNPKKLWDSKLKSNLSMNTQHSLLDQIVEESLAIVANTETWDVQLISSHTYVIDKGTNGVRVGMSQLVANICESLLQMWKLHIPSQYCILHIEQRLQELCIRSKAFAQILLASEFCSMELLTSTLRIEVNDVPLLMAVASTHTPEVTQKYGLSFQ